jgi:26S proteasome regulatory subunit (ATPase 3-interacting protein)
VTKEMREEVEREWKKCVGLARRREKVARACWVFIEDAAGVEGEAKQELREGFGLDD